MAGANSSESVPSGVRGVCPEGWHLPSIAEWDSLIAYVERDSRVGAGNGGAALKSMGTVWSGSSGEGQGIFGFRVLPAGFFGSGSSSHSGSYASFWSASDGGAYYAWYRFFSNGSATLNRSNEAKQLGFSLRCLRD